MSSEDNFRYSSVSAAIEKPSVKAVIRIFLVDPNGRRPPELWSSDQGKPIKYHETIAARMLRILRRRYTEKG